VAHDDFKERIFTSGYEQLTMTLGKNVIDGNVPDPFGSGDALVMLSGELPHE
jgi:hypothetical protein